MAISKSLKRRLRRNWNESKKRDGLPSLEDAREAAALGIINLEELGEVEKQHQEKRPHHALSRD